MRSIRSGNVAFIKITVEFQYGRGAEWVCYVNINAMCEDFSALRMLDCWFFSLLFYYFVSLVFIAFYQFVWWSRLFGSFGYLIDDDNGGKNK